MNHQLDIDKVYFQTKDPYEAKYQQFINKCKGVGSEHGNIPKTFIEYLNDMDNIYDNIDEYNPNKNHKISIVFDDMNANMLSNKNL